MSLASGVGLISGLNFNDIIAQLISVSARPVSLMRARQQTFRGRQEALQSVNKQLLNLKGKLEALQDQSSFSRRSITVMHSRRGTWHCFEADPR